MLQSHIPSKIRLCGGENAYLAIRTSEKMCTYRALLRGYIHLSEIQVQVLPFFAILVSSGRQSRCR